MKRRKLKRLSSTGAAAEILRAPAQILSYIPGSSLTLRKEIDAGTLAF